MALASPKIGDRLLTAAQIAGVLATGWFVWTTALLPRLGLRSIGGIAAEALLYVALAWLGGALVTFGVHLVVALADLPRATRFSLSSSTAAMWFAPAIVLLSAPVAAAFAVSLLLIANATRQLISQWAIIDSPFARSQPARTERARLFHSGGPDALLPLPVLMGSFASQAGLVAKLWGHPLSAAILFALSMAILTSLSISTGAYRPEKPATLPHSALSVIWTFLLAALLTLGGISARGRYGAGSEAASAPSISGRRTGLAGEGAAPPMEGMAAGGDFPGVVLLPPLKPHASLLLPVFAPAHESGAPLVKPLGIPFNGEYWMFRWPAKRPPRGATVRRGSPSDLSFHTPDGWPMEMEAHQRLDPPIGTKCCSAIQLVVNNADQDPMTVWLMELVLLDASAPNQTVVLATPVVEHRSAFEQIVTFRMPFVAALASFDEIKVVLHRARWRADKSARIAIERFVLLP